MPVMLGEQIPKCVVPVTDTAIAQAARMGSSLGLGKQDNNIAPIFPHTSFKQRGVCYESNGLRQGYLLVAQATPRIVLPEGALLASRMGSINLAPFSVRKQPTQAGLAVAELDHIDDNRLPGAVILLVGQQSVDREPLDEKQLYALTTLDDLIAYAHAYITKTNVDRKSATGHSDITSKSAIGPRMAINHVLKSLDTPVPEDEMTQNRRRAAGVPLNIDPVSLYKLFSDQFNTIHSNLTEVTYTPPQTISAIERWITLQLTQGKNTLATYYEAAKRVMQAQLHAQSEKKRGEDAFIDQKVQALQREISPTPKPHFPPLPEIIFFSDPMRPQAAENLKHFREERATRMNTYQRTGR